MNHREESGNEWLSLLSGRLEPESAKFSYGGIRRRFRGWRIRSPGLSTGRIFPMYSLFNSFKFILIVKFISQRLKAALHYTVGRICEKAGTFHFDRSSEQGRNNSSCTLECAMNYCDPVRLMTIFDPMLLVKIHPLFDIWVFSHHSITYLISQCINLPVLPVFRTNL